jgi:Ran GTPase-activating protein (RanGAP) involved in mRNA processing and transport
MLDVTLLEELKEALLDTESLLALNLYSNDINAEGAQLISQMLANKTNLKILGLSNNMIGHGGARELAGSLKDLKNLQ